MPEPTVLLFNYNTVAYLPLILVEYKVGRKFESSNAMTVQLPLSGILARSEVPSCKKHDVRGAQLDDSFTARGSEYEHECGQFYRCTNITILFTLLCTERSTTVPFTGVARSLQSFKRKET